MRNSDTMHEAHWVELPTALPDVRRDALTLDNLDYWITWCAKHRSGSLAERIRQARIEADKVAASYTEQWCARKNSRYGLADYPCSIPGCNQRAMLGRKLCCLHGIDDTDHKRLIEECYAIRPALFA